MRYTCKDMGTHEGSLTAHLSTSSGWVPLQHIVWQYAVSSDTNSVLDITGIGNIDTSGTWYCPALS